MKAIEQQLSFPFYLFEMEILDPLNGQQMSATETCIAQLLLETTSEKPVKMAEIISQVADITGDQLNERQVKIIVRSFRRDRAFPDERRQPVIGGVNQSRK